MQPLKVYDYLTLARRRVLERVRGLSVEAYGREFAIGPGTVGRALTHVMVSEWYYVQRIRGVEVPPYEAWPVRWEEPPAFGVLEGAWEAQARETRGVLGSVRDWEAEIEYGVTADDGRAMVVTASAAGLFTQLVLHEVHHRAQVMNMLRQLGASAEELDYNALMFERRAAP